VKKNHKVFTNKAVILHLFNQTKMKKEGETVRDKRGKDKKILFGIFKKLFISIHESVCSFPFTQDSTHVLFNSVTLIFTLLRVEKNRIK
jgi:hypothetical protein